MKQRIALILVVAVAVESASCGTLIHPDRVGQPHTSVLDPSIVVMDGLGVIVFLIPGVVAFIVDFSTGAIYLPQPRFNPYLPPPGAYPPPGIGGPPAAAPPPQPLTRIDSDGATLTNARIEAIVRARTGQEIKLDDADVRVIRANNLQDASATLQNADSPAGR